MKNLNSQTQTHVVGNVTTLVTCWELTARNGEIRRFTAHTKDLVIGGNTFRAADGYTPGQITTTLTLSVDNLEVSGFLSMTGFTSQELLAGQWDHAQALIFEVSYEDAANVEIKLRKGRVGQITVTDNGFASELLGLTDLLRQKPVEVYSPSCRADLGDARCKVRLDPPTWQPTTLYTVRPSFDAGLGSVVKPSVQNERHFKCVVAGTSGGAEPSWDVTIGNQTVDGTVTWEAIQALMLDGSVTSVTNDRIFQDTTRVEADDFWQFGKVTWLTGNNAGGEMEVKASVNANGQIELVQLMPFAIQVGDTYRVHAGCNKSQIIHCRNKFDNSHNMRGEAYVPQKIVIQRVGGSGVQGLFSTVGP